MATISENLQTLKDSTDAIKQAIIDKGSTINGDITTWADAISGIETGGGGHSSLLVCRCNMPDPRTQNPRYYIAVFDNIPEGAVWNDIVGMTDISDEFTAKILQLSNRQILTLSGDYDYASVDGIELNDIIDTSIFYDFIYG